MLTNNGCWSLVYTKVYYICRDYYYIFSGYRERCGDPRLTLNFIITSFYTMLSRDYNTAADHR
jgi:hypothetical protein